MSENTFHILRELVEEVQCKPGWMFDLEDGEAGGLVLWITVPGVDSFNPGRKFTVRHPHPVPNTTFNAKSWRRWIMDQCLRTETHELGEWLRFGSGDTEMRPFLPTHGPGEDPYALRAYDRTDEIPEITPEIVAACGIPEMTPEMIEAGVTFLAEHGVNEFSTNIATPETVIDFYQTMEVVRVLGARRHDAG